MDKRLIRKTKSVCPICLNPIDAAVVERDGKVWFEKECPRHGPFKLLLSEHPDYYLGTSEFFFKIMPKDLPQDSYHLYLTDKCNLSCPICITESGQNSKIEDMSLDDADKIIQENRRSRFVLFGGEPTCYKDLPLLIRKMKKRGHLVMMCTNGLKMADRDYLYRLVEAGLDRVDLSFDGFDRKIYLETRGVDLLERKLKTLDNLKQLNLATGISMLVIRGMNEDQIGPVIDYAVGNSFVKNISFLALTFLGGAKEYSMDRYIMPDQIVDLVERHSLGRIRRDKMFYYQKAFNAYSSLIRKRRCFYYQSFVLFRKGKECIPINEILDFSKIDHELELYAKYSGSNRLLATFYLFKGWVKIAFSALSRPEGMELIKEAARVIFLYALPKGNYNRSSRLLNIIFTTACDPYKMDKDVSFYCHRGIFYRKEGKINKESFRYDYNFKLEKEKKGR
jgi:uncharacterized radical SAM superfamily Fe-S cluster-containing enzyme